MKITKDKLNVEVLEKNCIDRDCLVVNYLSNDINKKLPLCVTRYYHGCPDEYRCNTVRNVE